MQFQRKIAETLKVIILLHRKDLFFFTKNGKKNFISPTEKLVCLEFLCSTFFKQSEITLFKLISKRGTGEFSFTLKLLYTIFINF